MKFPLSEINRQEYLDKIFNLLQDDECKVFVDTNIFALFYRINNSARDEFFDWLINLVQKDRIKTPLWALNEYTNRFIRNQIEDYFGPLKKVKSIQNDFKELSYFLKMNVDLASLSNTDYSDLNAFNSDLDLINERLNYIKQTAKTKDESYKLKIHAEIQKLFEQTVLESDLQRILLVTQSLGAFRYEHKLPPGFEDKKSLNSYGDLIIWNEILNYCKSNKVKKGILITNDSKKDWVYAPNRIIENSLNKPNKNGQFKIIDPRLVYEFKSKTSSEDFHIISFDTLTQILHSNINGKFINLAKALQLDHQKSNKTKIDNPLKGEVKDSELPKNELTEAQSSPREELNFTYSKDALSDIDFPLHNKSFLIQIIIDLKSHNWYVQNPAIDRFLEYPEGKISETDDNKNILFVIGRNIYQSAQGGSASAVDCINNLRYIFRIHGDFYINHLLTGMMYEIYFDSKNEFRAYNYKSSFLNVIYLLEDLDRVSASFMTIRSFLTPHSNHLLYLPNSDNINVEIILTGEVRQDKDWFGKEILIQDVSNILVNNEIELLTNIETDVIAHYYHIEGSKTMEIVNTISNIYGVPIEKITIVIDFDENIILNFGDKDFRKLS